MKVMENLETEELRQVEAVLYIVFVASRIKDYAFQINRLLQNEVKRRKIQAKEGEEQRQMESSQQRQMRLQDISAR